MTPTVACVKQAAQTACVPRRKLQDRVGSGAFARWLLQVAESHRWGSGRQAAIYLGVNHQTFGSWLDGTGWPDPDSQALLADKTGESIQKIAAMVAADKATERELQGWPARRPAIDVPAPLAIRNERLRLLFYDLAELEPTDEELGPIERAVEIVKRAKERERGLGGRGRGRGVGAATS